MEAPGGRVPFILDPSAFSLHPLLGGVVAQAAKPDTEKTITVNRKAGHDYELLDRYQAGIALTGTEIKSIREGRLNLREAYARLQHGEIFLFNCHIAQYQAGSYQNHEPTRPRKLLLHKSEILRLAEATSQKGLTIVPTRMYYSRGRAKVELAVARGKKSYDKRAAIADRDAQRQMARAIRHAVR
jgi:SsrA-binding protein